MRHPRVPAIITALVLVLTGCAGGGAESAGEPQPVGEPLPVVDTSALRPPIPFEGLAVVDPGWNTVPQYADGVFLAAREQEGRRRFTAVDTLGDIRWSVDRPARGAGFTVSADADGRAVAVFLEAGEGPGKGADGTSATAYDLETGTPAWGPVEVSGPHRGPGLVFGDPSRDSPGPEGDVTALDPSTGRALSTESDTTGPQVIGEYQGAVLIADGKELAAMDASTGDEAWRVPVAEHGAIERALEVPGVGSAPGLALLRTEQATGLLVDLQDGSILSDTAREAAVDPGTGAVAVLDDTGLHAIRDGERVWSLTVPDDTHIAALGGALLYLRGRGAVRVHNVITGEIAEAYDPSGAGSSWFQSTSRPTGPDCSPTVNAT